MRAMYHKGEIIMVVSAKQASTLVYEMTEAVSRAEQTIINHKSLARAYKEADKKLSHKKAAARAETRHKELKKLAEDLEAAIKASFK
jgi:hypothetical protein